MNEHNKEFENNLIYDAMYVKNSGFLRSSKKKRMIKTLHLNHLVSRKRIDNIII